MRSAAMTCAVAVVAGVLSFASSRSTIEAGSNGAVVPRPVELGNLVFQVMPLDGPAKPDGTIRFRLDIHNPSRRPRAVTGNLCVYTTSAVLPLWRTMPQSFPEEVWRRQFSVDLSRGESKTFVFETGVTRSKGSIADVRLATTATLSLSRRRGRAKLRESQTVLGALNTVDHAALASGRTVGR